MPIRSGILMEIVTICHQYGIQATADARHCRGEYTGYQKSRNADAQFTDDVPWKNGIVVRNGRREHSAFPCRKYIIGCNSEKDNRGRNCQHPIQIQGLFGNASTSRIAVLAIWRFLPIIPDNVVIKVGKDSVIQNFVFFSIQFKSKFIVISSAPCMFLCGR